MNEKNFTSQAARVEVISTGNEILEGLYADRNSQLISERLFEWGCETVHHTTVGDNLDAVKAALAESAKRADIVIMTGGIGPTEDDYNREAVSEFCKRPLVKNEKAEEWIRELYRRRHRDLPESNLRQALIPDGAVLIHNEYGTAPGFIVPDNVSQPAIIALPGPRREFTVMLDGPVREFIEANFPLRSNRQVLVLQTTGIPESEMNERLADLWKSDPRARMTLLSQPLRVTVRVIAEVGPEDSNSDVHALINRRRAELIERLGKENILGEGDITHAEVIRQLFVNGGWNLAVAESCTGGMVSAALTDVSGSSAYVIENCVTYSNEAKERLLGVKKETLRNYGAVSSECAAEMAEGIRRNCGADVGISVTGIAGPGGGSAEKPVGLVFIGLCDDSGIQVHRHRFPGDRGSVRLWACQTCLDLLRRWAIKRKQ